MKHIKNEEAVRIAYKNLYNSKLKKISKNLNILLRAKKNLAMQQDKNKKPC